MTWHPAGLVVVALVLFSAPGAVDPKPKPDPVEEVEACLERNRPKKSLVESVDFVHSDPEGGTETCSAFSYSRRGRDDRAQGKLIYARPPSMRGIEVVSLDRGKSCWETWLYLPDERDKRLLACGGGGQPIYCTNMTQEDLQGHWDPERRGRHERLEDTELADRPVYVMETYPEPEDESEYDKFVSWIDKKTCVVLREDSWLQDEPTKRMTAEAGSLEEVNGIWLARKSQVDDLDNGTRTEMTVEAIEVDVPIHRKVFDPRNMGTKAGTP
jgi:hypothetical protein